MKKTILFIALILLANSFNSCKKEINDQPIEKSYRIKQIIDDSGLFALKYIYTYQNDKIVHIDILRKEASEVWKNDWKAEITYSGNNVTKLYYRLYLDNWKIFNKDDYIIDNHKLLEKASYSYYDGQSTGLRKNVSQFSGEKLIASQYFISQSNVFEITEKINYYYEGDTLKDFKVYHESSGIWEEDYKADFIYLNNKLSSVQHFYKNSSDIWIGDYRIDYSYLGKYLSKTIGYEWNDETGNWNSEFDYDYLFTYDGKGNLSETESTDGEHYTFEYEEGNGNLSDFLDPASKIYKLPDAFTDMTMD